MNETEFSRSPDQPPQLRDISTRWSWIEAARKGGGNDPFAVSAALRALMERYFGAVHRYLLAAVGADDVAEDLAQEFAVRFLRGGFQRADRSKGRFRDYVKASLQHLLADHFHNRKVKSSQPMSHSALERGGAQTNLDSHFHDVWRAELLECAWRELANLEATGRTPYYTVLRWQVESPELTARDLADRLNKTASDVDREATTETKTYHEAGVRQLLHRTRQRFAEILFAEVARSLEGDEVAIEDELNELGLTPYCRSALSQWKRSKQ